MSDTARIARQIFKANREGLAFEPLADKDRPATLEHAYDIQDEVHRLFADEAGAGPIGGHKIALTSKAMQDLCGLDQPAYGQMAGTAIHRSPYTARITDTRHLGLEFELAAEMKTDVPASGAPYDRNNIRPYVRALMPAFELTDDRNADYTSVLKADWIITDRCWCAGAVLGDPVTDWQDIDLVSAPVELEWNGEIVDRGVAGASMDHPLNGLAWVANHLIGRGRTLSAGDIVITGSALLTRFPEAGDTVTYRIAGLGETTVRVVD